MAGRVLGDDYLTADGEYCAAPLYSEEVEKWRRLENAEREKQALQSVPCPIAGIFAHAARPFAQRLATVRFPGSIQIPEGHSKLFQFPHVRRDDHADGERMGVPSDDAPGSALPEPDLERAFLWHGLVLICVLISIVVRSLAGLDSRIRHRSGETAKPCRRRHDAATSRMVTRVRPDQRRPRRPANIQIHTLDRSTDFNRDGGRNRPSLQHFETAVQGGAVAQSLLGGNADAFAPDQRCTDAPGPPVSDSSTASARSFRPRAPMTLSTVSRLGLRSPDSAL